MHFRWSIACLALALCTCHPPAAPANVVLILVDDLGVTDLGCYGSSFYETPHIDALAADAARFTQAYAASPVCSPTRSSIHTGKSPARTRHTNYFGAPQPDAAAAGWPREGVHQPLLPAPYTDRLAASETTLAEAFRAGGYRTFFAGKWHLGPEGSWPEDHGFDINRCGIERGSPHGGGRYFSPYDNPRLEDGPVGEHLPDRLTVETAAFIRQHRDQSFLACLSFYSVHTPLMARPDLEAKYTAKKAALGLEDRWGRAGERPVREVQCHPVYAAMVEAMDQAVGRVIEALRETGCYDRTVVVFFSENGGLSTAEGHPTSNLPFRAGKGWLYEGGIREPLLLRWPGHTRPGQLIDAPVISTDLYPTLLAMTGLPLLPVQHPDGQGIGPLLRGDTLAAGRALWWHYPHYSNQGGRHGAAVRAGDWKLIRWFETDAVELYNLTADPGERHDLHQAEPAIAVRLRARLDTRLRETDALLPLPNPAWVAPAGR
ncbi:MAG: sulfatase [Bacteroidia bacterium]